MKQINGRTKTYTISQSDCFQNIICRLGSRLPRLNPDDIQNKRGVYIFWDWQDNLIRIGKAVKARNRILSYYTSPRCRNLFDQMENDIAYVSVIYTADEMESIITELDLLQEHKPKYNTHNAR